MEVYNICKSWLSNLIPRKITDLPLSLPVKKYIANTCCHRQKCPRDLNEIPRIKTYLSGHDSFVIPSVGRWGFHVLIVRTVDLSCTNGVAVRVREVKNVGAVGFPSINCKVVVMMIMTWWKAGEVHCIIWRICGSLCKR